jgi:hypothetical protein
VATRLDWNTRFIHHLADDGPAFATYDRAMENGRTAPPDAAVATERRGIVVPFRRRGADTRLDALLNGEWDRLLELALEASTRRDENVLQAIRDQVARVRVLIDRDWS